MGHRRNMRFPESANERDLRRSSLRANFLVFWSCLVEGSTLPDETSGTGLLVVLREVQSPAAVHKRATQDSSAVAARAGSHVYGVEVVTQVSLKAQHL